jgi:hypothetical protein
MFEAASPAALFGEIEASVMQESASMALWRNHMRKMRILFKGNEPSTSPWCTWVNEPFEPEVLPPDWKPPPPPSHQLADEPPF